MRSGLAVIGAPRARRSAASWPPTRAWRAAAADARRRSTSGAGAARGGAGDAARRACGWRPGPRLSVRGDGDQLEQLLINLVRNAVDAARRDRRRGQRRLGGGAGARWSWCVSDEGPGLRGHAEPLRALLHDQAPGLGHRAGAVPADRRGAPGHAQPAERRGAARVRCATQAPPGGAAAAGGDGPGVLRASGRGTSFPESGRHLRARPNRLRQLARARGLLDDRARTRGGPRCPSSAWKSARRCAASPGLPRSPPASS